MTIPNELDHIVARLAAEEGEDHPRQKTVRWLEKNGYAGHVVASFNREYAARVQEAEETGRYSQSSIEGFSAYLAFLPIGGHTPQNEVLWANIVRHFTGNPA